jgi:hypothetical protein
MADEIHEPRRFKLPSEFTDEDHAATSRLGNAGRRPEHDEYVKWRERVLRDERDDLELRERLLGEQAGVLRTRASDQQTDAWSSLTADDHHAHLVATREAKGNGVSVPELDDGGASKLERKAADLEAEAQEIHQSYSRRGRHDHG